MVTQELHLLREVLKKISRAFHRNVSSRNKSRGRRHRLRHARQKVPFARRSPRSSRARLIRSAWRAFLPPTSSSLAHVGVSIGEGRPVAWMALEDLAMMRAVSNSVVLYPSDAVSTEKLLETMAQTRGLFFMRTSRPKTPVIYSNEDKVPIGGAKIVRQNEGDKVTVVGAGVTLHEAIKAADLLARGSHRHHGGGRLLHQAIGQGRDQSGRRPDEQHRRHRRDHYAEGGFR